MQNVRPCMFQKITITFVADQFIIFNSTSKPNGISFIWCKTSLSFGTLDVIKCQYPEGYKLINFTWNDYIILGVFPCSTEVKRGDKESFMPPPDQHHPGDKNPSQPSTQSWRNHRGAPSPDKQNKTLSTLCQTALKEHSLLHPSLLLIASGHRRLSACM